MMQVNSRSNNMDSVLHIGNRTISQEEIFPLVRKYAMLPQLVREIVIENAIADITLSEEENSKALVTTVTRVIFTIIGHGFLLHTIML